jgi:hypothetical protein
VHLIAKPRTAVAGYSQALLMLLALFMISYATTTVTNTYNPQRPQIQLLVVVTMLGTLLMAVAVPQAFGQRGLVFAGAYVAIHIGRGLYLVVALRGHPAQRRSRRSLFWSVMSAVPWIAGALVPPAAGRCPAATAGTASSDRRPPADRCRLARMRMYVAFPATTRADHSREPFDVLATVPGGHLIGRGSDAGSSVRLPCVDQADRPREPSMQPDQAEPRPVPPPTPSASSSPARHGRVPATSDDVPTLTAPALIGPLRVAAGLVVAGLAVNVLLDLADTLLTPWAKGGPPRRRVAADNPLIVLTDGLAWLQLGRVRGHRGRLHHLALPRPQELDTWQIRGLRWGPGWAIRAWVLPLANLVMPALVMNTVVRGSRTPPDETEAPPGDTALVWVWWLIYLCAAIGGALFTGQDFDANDSRAHLAGYHAVGTIPSMVAAGLAIALVLRISGQQSRRQAALDQRPAYPAGV